MESEPPACAPGKGTTGVAPSLTSFTWLGRNPDRLANCGCTSEVFSHFQALVAVPDVRVERAVPADSSARWAHSNNAELDRRQLIFET